MNLLPVALFVACLLETYSPVVVVYSKKGEPHGAAVVVDSRGYLVTCIHVLEGRRQVPVQFRDGTSGVATVVGQRISDELAILKVDGPVGRRYMHLKTAKTAPRVREPVVAVGHPRGWLFTETTGTVTAVGRTVPWPAGGELRGLLQTDAAVNAGNSGGALLNASGELLGVPVAIREGAQGIAFAVPASAVRKLLVDHLPGGD